MSMMGPETVSIDEAAPLLGVSRQLVLRWIDEDLLSSAAGAAHRRITVDSVLALKAARSDAGHCLAGVDHTMELEDQHPDAQLLRNIKRDLPSLTVLADEVTGEWAEEDLVYRFWHQSFKVYWIQDLTLRIVGALENLAPADCELNERFRLIIDEGTGNTFEYEHNQRWLAETRPMLEAFWHAEYMLRMAVRYGRELDAAPSLLPSGWASLLYLYGIR